MNLAIMQPYFFPYIGYFQLIQAVDIFVFYDDVYFIKGGWINRNKILINKEPKYINAQLIKSSSFKKINEIHVQNKFKKLLKTIEQNYKKAPNFNEIYSLINDILNQEKNETISNLNIRIIKNILTYLNIKTKIEISSLHYADTLGLGRTQRILEICKRNKAKDYINAAGGKILYTKEEFLKNGLNLFFLEPQTPPYKQFNNEFKPNLSIIDVLMFNSKDTVKKMLNNYQLI